jgi:hypothetical protein
MPIPRLTVSAKPRKSGGFWLSPTPQGVPVVTAGLQTHEPAEVRNEKRRLEDHVLRHDEPESGSRLATVCARATPCASPGLKSCEGRWADLYLVSDEAIFTTAQCHVVDGGWSN